MAQKFWRKNQNLRLGEGQLEPRHGACVVCNGERLVLELRLQHDPEVWLALCSDCRIASADRIPRAGVLDSYYRDYYRDVRPDQPVSESVTIGAISRLARSICEQFGRPTSSDAVQVLDFGGGDGTVSLTIAESLLVDGAPRVEIS